MEKQFYKNTFLHQFKGYLFMLLGCICYGVSTSLFLEPNNIIAGGISGLAVTVNFIFKNLPVGMLIIALNIPILIFGVKAQGWKFILKCLLTVVCLGLITDLLAIFSYVTESVTDKVITSLYAGICQGIGIGLFVRYQFSSGGTELLGRLISNKMSFIKINVCVGILDAIVVIVGTFVTNDINNMLYALIVIFCSTKVSEIILVGIEKSKLCIIISDKGVEISEVLLKNSPRGITMISGEGMYTHKNHNVLFTCVKNRQLSELKSYVYKVDPNAFVIVNDANEVRGKGFMAFNENQVEKDKK